MLPRIAFITIGQTPRTDLVPEIVRALPVEIDAVELGALDGVDEATLETLAPGPGESRLVTRLSDGREVVIRHAWAEARLAEIIAGLDPAGFTATVLLCTGEFSNLWPSGGLFLGAQAIVDHGIAALTEGARRIGVLLPHAEQLDDFHFRPRSDQQLVLEHASPYGEDRLDEAACNLRDVDLVVMHCMGYTERMRSRVAEVTGRPVLLARRLVAAALLQVL